MKHLIYAIVFSVLATSASAKCFVEYKAKQDDPLSLHYGWLAFDGDCPDDVVTAMEDRLANTGWSLLTVVSVSTTAPTPQQQEDAGDFFLKF